MREAAQKKPCRVPKVDPELRLGILASADMRVDKEWSKIDLRDKDKIVGVTHIWGNATMAARDRRRRAVHQRMQDPIPPVSSSFVNPV